MASILEEKLREAACVGDIKGVIELLSHNVDINSKNNQNGWTALHWACKRGHENIVQLLINQGADVKVQNNKGETPARVASSPVILQRLGEVNCVLHQDDLGLKFTPNYIKNSPINDQVDIGQLRTKHTDFTSMPTTSLPAMQQHEIVTDLVLKVKIFGASDPDFIEVEIPRWKLTYNDVLKICCAELEVMESQVERIRKLPNTRLRNDSDVKRLIDYQALELVMKTAPGGPDKSSNCYQSISTCSKEVEQK